MTKTGDEPMTKSLRDVFTEAGMRAEYNGHMATVVPLTEELLASINPEDLAKAGPSAAPGKLMISWSEDGKRRGSVREPFSNMDLSLKISLSGGGERTVDASDPARAAEALTGMIQADAFERIKIADDFEKSAANYEKAIARGEHPEAPVAATPTYTDDAFAKVTGFIETAKQGLTGIAMARFTSAMEENYALSRQAALVQAESNTLNYDDAAKAASYRAIREQIGRIQPDHALAVKSVAAPYNAEGAGEATSLLLEEIQVGNNGMGAMDASAIFPNRQTTEEIFSVLTTTPASQITARPLRLADANRIADDLAHFAINDWKAGADARLNEVFAKRMPAYVNKFESQAFSKEDADILLIADRSGIVMYAWDTASRVNDLDVEATVLKTLGAADVPSDEQMEAAKEALLAVQYNPADEVDFGWDAPTDPTDISKGPQYQ